MLKRFHDLYTWQNIQNYLQLIESEMETSLYNESNYYTSWADKSVKSDNQIALLSVQYFRSIEPGTVCNDPAIFL